VVCQQIFYEIFYEKNQEYSPRIAVLPHI